MRYSIVGSDASELLSGRRSILNIVRRRLTHRRRCDAVMAAVSTSKHAIPRILRVCGLERRAVSGSGEVRLDHTQCITNMHNASAGT